MEPVMITVIGALFVSLTTNMVQLFINRNKAAFSLPMANGALTSTMDARIAFHTLKCPNLDAIMTMLAEMREDMKDHLKEHRDNANRDQWHDPATK